MGLNWFVAVLFGAKFDLYHSNQQQTFQECLLCAFRSLCVCGGGCSLHILYTNREERYA